MEQTNTIMDKYTNLIQTSMKSHDVNALKVYRLIKKELLDYKSQPGTPVVDEAAEIKILNKMSKEFTEESNNNKALGKSDRAAELDALNVIVQNLLPKAATQEEITSVVDSYINEHGAITQKDMGAIMSLLKTKFTNFDGKLASTIIKSKI